MTVPEYLAALAIACFLIAFAAYIVHDIDKLAHAPGDRRAGAEAPPRDDGAPARPYDQDQDAA